MTPDLVVEVRADGTVIGGGTPTREASMHLQILYRRPEARIVCHVHGAYIIACSSILNPGPDSLPPITPGFAYAAHPIEMLPFLPPGSSELASKAADALSSPKAKGVLLQSHGLVTIGKDYREAVNTAEEIEEAALIFFITKGKAPAIPHASYLTPQGGASGTP
jgi:ribulose-5-phosphate 4-epimerase/fuculose-1-phosphate aldolase